MRFPERRELAFASRDRNRPDLEDRPRRPRLERLPLVRSQGAATGLPDKVIRSGFDVAVNGVERGGDFVRVVPFDILGNRLPVELASRFLQNPSQSVSSLKYRGRYRDSGLHTRSITHQPRSSTMSPSFTLLLETEAYSHFGAAGVSLAAGAPFSLSARSLARTSS